jgi:hypothetical protein
MLVMIIIIERDIDDNDVHRVAPIRLESHGQRPPRPPAQPRPSAGRSYLSAAPESSLAINTTSRSSTPVSRSATPQSTADGPFGHTAPSLYNVTAQDLIVPPLVRTHVMALPCAHAYVHETWVAFATKPKNRSLMEYILKDDSLKTISLAEHLELVFHYMFHLFVTNPEEKNVRILAINGLEKDTLTGTCFSHYICSAIMNSTVFNSDLFKRRIEYFKRSITDAIFKLIPVAVRDNGTVFNDLKKPYNWISQADYSTLKVALHYNIFM